MGSVATYNVGVLTENPTLGSESTCPSSRSCTNNFLSGLLQVSFAYAIGIVLAITINAMSSGGHFNPAVTIPFAMFRGFPWKKVPLFIFAQCLGAYVAAMVVYGSWRETLLAVEAGLKLAGKEAVIYSPTGTAGIFALYAPAGVPLKWVFMNEFFADFFIGCVSFTIRNSSYP